MEIVIVILCFWFETQVMTPPWCSTVTLQSVGKAAFRLLIIEEL